MAFFQPGKYLSHTLHLSRKTRNQATSKQDKTSSAKTKWLLARSLFRCTPTGISYTAFNIYKLITKFQLFFFFSPQKRTVSQNSQLTLNTPSAPSSRGTRTPLCNLPIRHRHFLLRIPYFQPHIKFAYSQSGVDGCFPSVSSGWSCFLRVLRSTADFEACSLF